MVYHRPMEASIEQRRHPRLNVMDAVVVTPNGHGHDTHVLDISSGGVRLAAFPGWSPVHGADLKILFLPSSDMPIVMQARVARVATDHFGLEFGDQQDDDVRQVLEALGRTE